MRIGRVFVDGDDRTVFPVHAVGAHQVVHEALDLHLARRAAGLDAAGDFLEGFVLHHLHDAAGFLVAFVVLHGQMRLEASDQVAARHHLDAEAPDQFDRARVHDGDVGNVVFRRILHRDGLRRAEHRLQHLLLLRPRQVHVLRAREVVAAPGLDAMHELLRFALGGNVIEPAPRGEAAGVHVQDARGDGVAVVEIVKEPAVDAGFAQCGLNRVQIHRELPFLGEYLIV